MKKAPTVRRLETWTLWRRRIISAIIVWHLAAMLVWLMPTSYLRQALVGYVRPYILSTSCWQQWNLFGPDPVHTDVHIEARITYENGVIRPWFFPRPGVSASLANIIDTSSRESGHGLWPYMARYAARVCRRPAADIPPIRVELRRYSRQVQPPGSPAVAFVYDRVYSGDLLNAGGANGNGAGHSELVPNREEATNEKRSR